MNSKEQEPNVVDGELDETGAINSSIDDPNSNDNQETSHYETVPINSGNALDLSTSKMVTSRRPTRLIVVAGPVDSGKTTLLMCIYNSLQKAPYAGYLFAGSITLTEFERCSHDSRIASWREYPTTERTKLQEDYRFLHLCVRNQKLRNEKKDLLFADLSGEVFDAIKNSEEECRRHEIVKRVDHLVLTLDGHKLSNPFESANAVNGCYLLLRRLIDTEMLGSGVFVDVVFTKWDLIKRRTEKDSDLPTYIKKVQRYKFQDAFPEIGDRFHFTNVSAQPDPKANSGLPWGYGVDSLLKRWLEVNPTSRIQMDESVKTPIERQIDFFASNADCYGKLRG